MDPSRRSSMLSSTTPITALKLFLDPLGLYPLTKSHTATPPRTTDDTLSTRKRPLSLDDIPMNGMSEEVIIHRRSADSSMYVVEQPMDIPNDHVRRPTPKYLMNTMYDMDHDMLWVECKHHFSGRDMSSPLKPPSDSPMVLNKNLLKSLQCDILKALSDFSERPLQKTDNGQGSLALHEHFDPLPSLRRFPMIGIRQAMGILMQRYLFSGGSDLDFSDALRMHIRPCVVTDTEPELLCEISQFRTTADQYVEVKLEFTDTFRVFHLCTTQSILDIPLLDIVKMLFQWNQYDKRLRSTILPRLMDETLSENYEETSYFPITSNEYKNHKGDEQDLFELTRMDMIYLSIEVQGLDRFMETFFHKKLSKMQYNRLFGNMILIWNVFYMILTKAYGVEFPE